MKGEKQPTDRRKSLAHEPVRRTGAAGFTPSIAFCGLGVNTLPVRIVPSRHPTLRLPNSTGAARSDSLIPPMPDPALGACARDIRPCLTERSTCAILISLKSVAAGSAAAARKVRAMEQIALLTQGLVKFYGRFQALYGVNLEVRRGEIFGFLGPNGAGKTTTIRCCLDLIRPNGGLVRVLGLDPQADPVAVRARVGYLPGELHLDENFTVEGALRFLNELRDGKADGEFVRRLAERLALDLKMPIKNLSKGNKQKVGIVQAMMHRPELLLLDEPTFGLDPLMQQEVLRLVKEARADGATVFFSSHILSEVQEIADRVGIIRRGVVVEVAETASLLRRALRRVRVRFKEPVDGALLARVPGVKLLSQGAGTDVLLQVEGEMNGLIKALATLPVSDLDTERPSLEEIFLAYYETERKEGQPR